MTTTIDIDANHATLINILTVEPDKRAELLELLKESTEEVICKMPGWISTSFLTSGDGRRVVIYSQWRSPGDIEAMRNNPALAAYFPRIGALAALESIACDVSYVHHA